MLLNRWKWKAESFLIQLFLQTALPHWYNKGKTCGEILNGDSARFYFWKILRSLVVEHNYRLINISGDHSEVWLEPFRNKYFQLVRFVRKDIDWGNWISQDIEHTAHIFETIRKQSMRRDLNILNIYVTTFPPVDDWEFRIKEPFAHGKTVVKTMLLDQEHIMEKTGDLEDALSVSLKKLDYAAEESNFESVERIKEEIFSYIKRQERLERSFLKMAGLSLHMFFNSTNCDVFSS